METLIEHVLEAQVAAPPPRRAQLPLRLTFLLTVATLLLGVFVLGSGRALWEAGKMIWIAQAGRTATGSVVAIQTQPSPEKNQPPQQVAIRYQAEIPDGKGGILVRSGWIGLPPPVGSGVKTPDQPIWRIGQMVPVRYAPWFGGVASRPWQTGPGGRIVSLTLSGGLVLVVSLLLGQRLRRWTRERLQLLRLGVATVGTIIHKRTEAEDMLRYYLRYGYASAPGQGREREDQVSMEQWKRFEVGQPVTVLFHPEQPEQAGLYALLHEK